MEQDDLGDVWCEMFFSYHGDYNNVTLHWCCGRIQTFVPDKSEINNCIEVQVMWDEEYVEVADIILTKELEKKN